MNLPRSTAPQRQSYSRCRSLCKERRSLRLIAEQPRIVTSCTVSRRMGTLLRMYGSRAERLVLLRSCRPSRAQLRITVAARRRLCLDDDSRRFFGEWARPHDTHPRSRSRRGGVLRGPREETVLIVGTLRSCARRWFSATSGTIPPPERAGPSDHAHRAVIGCDGDDKIVPSRYERLAVVREVNERYAAPAGVFVASPSRP